MSRQHDICDWLVATCPRGYLRGSSAASHESTIASFTRAHELAGHTVVRLTFQEAHDRLQVRPVPVQAPASVPPLPSPVAEVAADLPPIGETVRGPWGVGEVISHLRWPATHPTHAGRTAAHLRGPGGEGLAYPGEALPYQAPAIEPPAVAPRPPASTPPVLIATAHAQPIQPSLF